MRNTKQGFTLVELIVVITILAILGTIAFISLQGYSADARNSKRTSDLDSLNSAVITATTKGTPLLAFVDEKPDSQLASASIAGTGVIVGTDYNAGVPNYIAMDIKEEDFKDPNGPEYRMGATTKIDGKYEFAASMENGSGEKTAKVRGTYSPRTGVSVEATINWKKATITNNIDINTLKRWDISNGQTIVAVSSDGLTLTFDWTPSDSPLTLTDDETPGLIDADKDSVTGNPVTEWSTADLPY